MAGYETLSVEKRGQVDWLTLNRPDSVNAIDTPLVTELGDYFGGLAEDQETRIVVLRGAGQAFSAVLDIKDSQAGMSDHLEQVWVFGAIWQKSKSVCAVVCNRSFHLFLVLPAVVVSRLSWLQTFA